MGNVPFAGAVLCRCVLFLNGNVYPKENENLEVWMDKTVRSFPSVYGGKLWRYVWYWSICREEGSRDFRD